MAKRTKIPGDKIDINVIALIDIAFFVIVFLLITSEFASLARVENLALPTALEVRPEAAKTDRLVISVDHFNKIWIGGRPQNLDQVVSILRKERAVRHEDVAKETNQPILIEADRDVPWRTIQDIIEKAADMKFHVISFAAKKEAEPK